MAFEGSVRENIEAQLNVQIDAYKFVLENFTELAGLGVGAGVGKLQEFNDIANRAEVAYYIQDSLNRNGDDDKAFMNDLNAIIQTALSAEGIRFGLRIKNIIEPWWKE